MRQFDSLIDAQSFVQQRVDRPAGDYYATLGNKASFHAFTLDLAKGQFTNVYDVSLASDRANAAIHIHHTPTDLYSFASNHMPAAAISGGFFFLADHYQRAPRQAALNLAIADGQVRSLPVVDREAILTRQGRVSGRQIQALGELSIGNQLLSWAGSLTDHEAEVSVFGNGNAVIKHQSVPETGSQRVLEESSRFTPTIEQDDLIDIGLIHLADNHFRPRSISRDGGLNIFAHDLVLRCHERVLAQHGELVTIRSVGSLSLDAYNGSAISVGPSFDTPDFDAHAINQDRSLGDKPPFVSAPLARTMLYETVDGELHLRLFDGRRDSQTFPGVTPEEAIKLTEDEADISWGYFLDPGQTAKLGISHRGRVASFGNRHYLMWPKQAGEPFAWAPYRGRPDASVITLQ